MKKNVLLCTLFLLFVSAYAQAATTYYVSMTGSDSNPGTETRPFLSCDKAASLAINPGDQVIIKGGTHTAYSGVYFCDIPQTAQGTEANPIVFKAETPPDKANRSWTTVIDGRYLVKQGFFVWYGAKHIRIEGIEIKNFKEVGVAIQGNRNDGGSPLFTENITLKDNLIHHIADNATTSCSDIYGKSGVFSNQWTKYVTLDGNIIHTIGRKFNTACTNKGDVSQTAHDHGWYAQGRKQYAVNNIFYNCFAGWAIKIDGYCTPLANNADDIPVGEWTHRVSNNSFSHGTNPGGVGHITFVNNATAACLGLKTFLTPHDVIVENNIFHKLPVGGSPPSALRFYYTNYFLRTKLRNNVSTGGLYMFHNTSYFGTETGSTIAVNADNVLNVPEADVYVDGTDMKSPDFMLKAGFSGIDAGYNNGLATDYAGNARVAPIDVGAYEYEGYQDLTPPLLYFIDNVAPASTGTDTVSVSWDDSVVKKWDYNEGSGCPESASNYTKTTEDQMDQADATHNGKYICLYGEDFVGNKSVLASAYPINVSEILTPPVFTSGQLGAGASATFGAGADCVFGSSL